MSCPLKSRRAQKYGIILMPHSDTLTSPSSSSESLALALCVFIATQKSVWSNLKIERAEAHLAEAMTKSKLC